MIVEDSMHLVYDETNPKLQDQVSKNADEDDLLQKQNFAAEKHFVAGNQLVEKEKQLTKKVVDNNLPKDWIQPIDLSKDNIIGDNREYPLDADLYFVNMLLSYLKLNLKM